MIPLRLIQGGARRRVGVRSITFVWSESPDIPKGATVTTWAEAEVIVRKVEVLPTMLGYWKTDFVIVFADGEEYEGRLDIGRTEVADTKPLARHVQRFCGAMSARECPPTMTPERRDEYLRATAASSGTTYEKLTGEFANFLDSYDLGGELGLEPVVPVVPPVPPAPHRPDGTYGAKYYKTFSTTDITKAIRRDLAEAVRTGALSRGLAFSVRKEHHRSIVVRITKIPPGLVLHSIKRRLADRRGEPTHGMKWLAPPAHEISKQVEKICEAYNYDRSDVTTDYFDVNFYLSVGFSSELLEADAREIDRVLDAAEVRR